MDKTLLETRNVIENSLPHISLDCVILGYHREEKSLKVLLIKFKGGKEWVLPGGFIFKEEAMEDAVHRILKFRTGLDSIFLKQFAVFGDPNRNKKKDNINLISEPWFQNRFITIGYYALVDYKSVKISTDFLSDAIEWKDINDLPSIGFDHENIIQEGILSLRKSLNLHPVGESLLPKYFTLPELQSLYEIILGRPLNRGNFYRKVMNYGLLIDTGKLKNTKGHRSPKLYTFNEEVYKEAVENGLQSIW